MQFRGDAGATAATLGSVATAFLQAIGGRMTDNWTIIGTRFRAANSDFSLPVTEVVAQPDTSGGTWDAVNNPRFVTWVGRGFLTGRRVRIFVYGLVFTTPTDYRLTLSEISEFNTARGILQAESDDGPLGTIGADAPQWYPYQNVGFNSYWEREQRGS